MTVLMMKRCAQTSPASKLLHDACLTSEYSELAGSVGLVAAVMIEKHLGDASKWAPYLSFLPDSFPGLPMNWPSTRPPRSVSASQSLPSTADNEAESLLRRSSIWERRRGVAGWPGLSVSLPHNISQVWSGHVRPVLSRYAEQKGLKGLRKKSLLSRDLFLWALSVVSSYSFTLGDAPRMQGLVPFWVSPAPRPHG